MGLVLDNYITKYGVKANYFEITNVSYNFLGNYLVYSGSIWVSKDLKEQGFEPIEEFEAGSIVDYSTNDNLLEYAYDCILDEANKEQSEESVFRKFVGCEKID